MGEESKQQTRSHWRCGQNTHQLDKCWFHSKECFNCGQKGYTKKCRDGDKGVEKEHTKWVTEKDSNEGYNERNDSENDNDKIKFAVYKVRAGRTGPYSVQVNIENVKRRMEVDTGAAVSIVSSKTWRKLGLKVEIWAHLLP